MTNDLISRSALLKALEYDPAKRQYNSPHSTFGVIEDAPAVDAVEVVRCEDCIHTQTDGCDDPAIYCEKWDRWEMPPDFFCAGGERRTDES